MATQEALPMSHEQVYTEWNGIQDPTVYLDRNADIITFLTHGWGCNCD